MTASLLWMQTATAQKVASLIEAEKAFARLAAQSTIRNAFLKNLDSNGVTFSDGNIYNGIRQFTAAVENSTKLLWHPVFACVSSSGDMGFTTGPYEVRKTMEAPMLVAGQYSSIWKKNSQGQWKLLVDLGTDYKNSLYDSNIATSSFSGLIPPPDNDTTCQQVEANFIKAYKANEAAAFNAVLTDGCWFNLQGRHPAFGKKAIQESLSAIPDSLMFLPAGSGVSKAGDLVYVYGAATHQGKKENYLWVWGHTKARWVLLLQVIKW